MKLQSTGFAAALRGGAAAGAMVVAMLALLPASQAQAQDAAQIVMRMGQLEDQVRTMSGQIEQLQFENRRLNEQMRKFQQDVDFRLQEKPSAGGGASSPPARDRRGDAGASTGSPATSPATTSPGGGQLAGQTGASGPGSSGGDIFDAARSQFQQRQYAAAEMGFRQFLQANSRDRRVPDALYWLGESYFQRQQYSEAAEQFLKISTDHAKSARGPDALVKLGMSLSRLNAKQEACATLAEVLRKYPNASVDVRSAVERERSRTKC